MQAKQFKNFTDTDFTWKYDGIEYTFKAGQTIFLEDFKANHFAKHLIDRELNAKTIPTNNLSERAKLEKECFPSDLEVTPVEALQLNETAKKSGKKKKVEKEFADLEH